MHLDWHTSNHWQKVFISLCPRWQFAVHSCGRWICNRAVSPAYRYGQNSGWPGKRRMSPWKSFGSLLYYYDRTDLWRNWTCHPRRNPSSRIPQSFLFSPSNPCWTNLATWGTPPHRSSTLSLDFNPRDWHGDNFIPPILSTFRPPLTSNPIAEYYDIVRDLLYMLWVRNEWVIAGTKSKGSLKSTDNLVNIWSKIRINMHMVISWTFLKCLLWKNLSMNS